MTITKKISFTFIAILDLIFFIYLLLPVPDFPVPPPDSIQSHEPADTETPLRRAYFTNSTREEVMDWYKDQMRESPLYNITLPTYRLNYPPEEAQAIIRDQTRSTFLEEIVHPFRESIFINGFEPKEKKDAIFIEGRDWRQKIIVKFVPSGILAKIMVFVLINVSVIALYWAWQKTLKDLFD